MARKKKKGPATDASPYFTSFDVWITRYQEPAPFVLPSEAEPARKAARPRASAVDEEIVNLLRREGRPVKASLIALRLHRDESYIRHRLADLKRRGRVRNVPGNGYVLA